MDQQRDLFHHSTYIDLDFQLEFYWERFLYGQSLELIWLLKCVGLAWQLSSLV